MLKRILYSITYIVLLAVLSSYLIFSSGVYANKYKLNSEIILNDEFKRMNFGENGLDEIYKFSTKNDIDFIESITVLMISYEYDLSGFKSDKITVNEYKTLKKEIELQDKSAYLYLKKIYSSILSDIKFFPIPRAKEDDFWVTYVDSWQSKRTYGGDRVHEGCDIMSDNNIRGFFPVVSMTDGIVENIGWLELGGYRIGIKSKNGGYYYYAHLYSYSDQIKEGDLVRAGELIGFMGDTGYSKVEGTTGNFDVHLHLGIYFDNKSGEQVSVNPYYILLYLEKEKLIHSKY